jgi:hypothetical protein
LTRGVSRRLKDVVKVARAAIGELHLPRRLHLSGRGGVEMQKVPCVMRKMGEAAGGTLGYRHASEKRCTGPYRAPTDFVDFMINDVNLSLANKVDGTKINHRSAGTVARKGERGSTSACRVHESRPSSQQLRLPTGDTCRWSQ